MSIFSRIIIAHERTDNGKNSTGPFDYIRKISEEYLFFYITFLFSKQLLIDLITAYTVFTIVFIQHGIASPNLI